MDWYGFKEGVELWTGLHMDALHVHAGIACQLIAALVLRRSLGSIWPLLTVAAIVLLNEAYDLRSEVWPNRGDQYGESIKDIWNTLLVPTLLMLAVRFVPRLFTGGRRRG